METSGCLTTCIASLTSMQHISEPYAPKALNELLSEQQVYDREGNLQWDRLEAKPNLCSAVFYKVNVLYPLQLEIRVEAGCYLEDM